MTDHARQDLHRIGAFIAEDSPVNASRFIAKLEEHCWLLASRPRMGRPRNELAAGLRSLAVGRYILFFRPMTDGAEIVRIIHGARDLQQALDESR
ncbi:MAG: type II toxin-antitoxin system RelE/ParE family toxin [Magnetococcales bacterium]|nr:type II toxin-antitoxin system RelE/ParE family toxin [Magnetococcales bacterium]